jgi:uncharacterized protein YhaN
MRLLSLDLDRYGPFSGKRLNFRPDARLHLVFGPNEAGKSCALAAVTDLLFGIERETRYDFIHVGKELRIGATICDRTGRELAFRRRKNKPLLTDPAETALSEDALVPFLGGLSRGVFCRAFGLDALALRRSGDELKSSDGELGAALFSAASGLRGFAGTKEAMERDADQIFGRTKKQSRRFFQASDRYEGARKRLREHETRAGALKALRENLEEQERRFNQINERRSALTSERTRLERLGRAAPVIAAIDDGESRLAALGALPQASDGFGALLIESIGKAAAAGTATDVAKAAERRFSEALNAMAVDDVLLERAEAVEELTHNLGAYLKALRDLPGVEREEAGNTQSMAGLASRLRMPDSATLLANQPDDASKARIAELVATGQRFQHSLEATLVAAAREREALDGMKRERDKRGALIDPRPLREQLKALSEVRKLAEQTETQAAAIGADSVALSEAAARLSPAVVDFDALAIAPLPPREIIAGFDARFADLDQSARSERQALEAVHQEIERLISTLDELAAGGAVPTAERIAALRADRDRHWSTLRPILFGDGGPPIGAALVDSVASFEAAKAEADRLADSAVQDAKRVASHADATRRLAGQQAQAAAIESRRGALTQAREEAVHDWSAVWAKSDIEPLAPVAMAQWSMQIDALMERRSKLQERRANTDRAVRQVVAAEPAVAALMAALGLSDMPGLSFEARARRIEAEIGRVAEAWEAARNSDTLLADLQVRAAAADEAARDAQQAVSVWRTQFAGALPRVGLPETGTIAEANAVLGAWKELPAIAAQRDSLQRRVAGMKRDAVTFQEAAHTLAVAVAPDLLDAEPQVALKVLNQRLTAAREARTKRLETLQRREEARAVALRAEDEKVAADRAVADLAEKIGSAVDASLYDVAGKLTERDSIVASLRQRRGELANAADGRPEAVLREALAAYEPETAEADLRRFADDNRALETEAQEVFAARKESRDRLASLEGAVEAEVALQQRRGAEAEMLEAAREWAVLSIGAMMISTSVTRQRLGRQEPLMVRAGELFALLTGDAYVGFGQVYDDDENPHVVGRRSGESGNEVKVIDMSEGTRDQLYLALRLAYIEDYASRVEPPPFLADDLFTSFDDRRTGYGLKALCAIGEKVQPILFTHHRFLVEVAQKELGNAVDVLDLG